RGFAHIAVRMPLRGGSLVIRNSLLLLALIAPMLTSAPVLGQTPETAAPPPAASSQFDTSYRPSEVVALRVQRKFLSDVRWSVGEAMKNRLEEAFAERKPTEIWLDLVEGNALTTNNVADALTAYWVLNWITANKAYDVKVEHGPIQAQVRL